MKIKLIPICVVILVFGILMTANAALWDRGGGLIYDDDLDITWLQDANYAGTLGQGGGHFTDGHMQWEHAMEWAANLVYQGYTDWRLPTALVEENGWDETEAFHLFVYEGISVMSPGPFNNLQLYYWSGTEKPTDPRLARSFTPSAGRAETIKSSYLYAWAVRDGDSAPAPSPAISVTSPDGGEELFGGSSHEITWLSEIVDRVKIEYSINNGVDWIEIVSTTENVGFYNWNVPCVIADDSLIKISDVQGEASDVSDAIFSMVDQDSDNDGIPDCMEDAGPNEGDGNDDLIPDSQQPNVASLKTYDGQSYITLESTVGTTISTCRAVGNPSPNNAPTDVDFIYGFFDFTINGVAPNASASVVLHHTDKTLETYYKYGPTPSNPSDHWYQFLDDGNTGADIGGNKITLNFVNGDRGDDDMDGFNSVIIDIGGPGSIISQAPQPPSNGGGGGGCFISTTFNSL